jgi:hypothetical protein
MSRGHRIDALSPGFIAAPAGRTGAAAHVRPASALDRP